MKSNWQGTVSTSQRIFLIIVGLLGVVLSWVLIGALPAYAAVTHHFTCADTISTLQGVTCANGNEFTFTHGHDGLSDYPSPNFQAMDGGTTYVTFDILSGSGNIAAATGGDNAGSSYYNITGNPGQQTDVSITNAASGNTGGYGGFTFYDNSGSVCGGSACTFDGTIKDICVSDTAGQCTGGGGGGGGSSGTPGVLAAQLDNGTLTTVWDKNLTSSASASNTGYVNIGTPFQSDVVVTGVQFYMKSNDDGTNGTLGSVGLVYADDGSDVCRTSAGTAINSIGTTTVDARNNMVLVNVSCGRVVDHNRPLAFEIWAWSTAHQSTVQTLGTGTTMYYQITGNGQYVNQTNFNAYSSSQLSSVIPASDATVATSTQVTVGGSGFINPADYKSGTYLLYQYRRYGSVDLVNPSAVLNIPITASGSFNVSQNVNITTPGVYVATAVVRQPAISFLGFTAFAHDVTRQVNWEFTVGTSTLAQRTQALSALNIVSVMAGQGQASSTLAEASTTLPCMPGDPQFSWSGCIYALFVPSVEAQGQMSGDINKVMSLQPWGYVTRGFALLSGNASSSEVSAISSDLPSLDVPIGQLPGASGVADLNLTPWGKLMGGSSILATATSTHYGLTFRQVVEPGWDFLVLFLFGLGVVAQVVGLPLAHEAEVQIQNVQRNSR